MMEELALIAEEMYALGNDSFHEPHPKQHLFHRYAIRIANQLEILDKKISYYRTKAEEQAFQIRRLENDIKELKKELKERP